jgi:hypothetical protein
VTCVTDRLDELAADIGRLRRRHPDDHIVQRAASHVEALALMLEPTAAQLAAWWAPGQEEAIGEAILIKDVRSRRLRELLGEAA